MSDDPASNVNGQKTAAPEKAPPSWLSRLIWLGPRVAETRAKTFGPAKPGFVWFDIARQLSDDTPEIAEDGTCSLAGILLDCAQVSLLVRAILEREGLLSDARSSSRVGSATAFGTDNPSCPPRAPSSSQGSPISAIDWANARKLPVIAEAFASLSGRQSSLLTAMLGPDRDAVLATLTGEDRVSFARAVRQLVICLSQPLALEARRLGRALCARWLRIGLATLVLAVCFGVTASWLNNKFAKPNLALHRPVTVSSQYPTEGTDHSLLVDGDPDNLGFHTQSGGQQWVVIDLGSVRKFNKVVVYNRPDGFQERAVPIRLEVSNDNVNFTLLRERKETFDTWTVSDLHAEGRYVRLSNTPPNFFHLAEVEIY